MTSDTGAPVARTCRTVRAAQTAPAAPVAETRRVRARLAPLAVAASLLACAPASGAGIAPLVEPGHLPAAVATSTADIERALAAVRPAMPGWRTATSLHSPDAVRALYVARDHRPVWVTPESVRTLRAALAGARADGLDVASFGVPPDEPPPGRDAPAHGAGAGDPFAPAADGPDEAARDIRLTDLLVTLLERLHRGTTDPGPVAPPAGRAPVEAEPVALAMARLSLRLNAGDVVGAVTAARPATPLYSGLRDALERHLEVRDGRGLPEPVGDGPTLEPGSDGERVERLRRRLAALDALDGLHGADRHAIAELVPQAALAGVPGKPFGPRLGAAVEAFQARHGLEADGKVGRLTLAAIDTTLDARIERLRVNLERARHIARALGDEDRVVVNVADQRLRLKLDGETTWETDVVVGQRKHRTPVHVGEIEWMELDPRWTVPRKIVLDTLYEKAKADPAAFANEGFVLRDLGGTWMDPREVDWETMTPERFHYDVVQRPGPRNPLGRAKFMFPNRYAVYLHDTPNRALFEEDTRAFSRGCVRVEHADTLAALLLEHRNGVRRPDIVTLRAAGDEVRIELDEPLTVALLYWTAEVDEEGRLRLIDDVYGRDAAAARELDGGTAS